MAMQAELVAVVWFCHRAAASLGGRRGAIRASANVVLTHGVHAAVILGPLVFVAAYLARQRRAAAPAVDETSDDADPFDSLARLHAAWSGATPVIDRTTSSGASSGSM